MGSCIESAVMYSTLTNILKISVYTNDVITAAVHVWAPKVAYLLEPNMQ